MFQFDHLAVSATSLEGGSAAVEAVLGTGLAGGGAHPHFGTHNRLLSLGSDAYLEVISIDPAAPPVAWPRWFGLDSFTGAPRLTNWVLRCDDLDAALARLGPGAGEPVELSRGEFRWRMAVPRDGLLPFDNLHPALIEWQGPHPAPRLPASGCRLSTLTVSHPGGARLSDLLGLDDPRIHFVAGAPGLSAEIETPSGRRVLR